MAYLNSTNVTGPAETIAALATFIGANGWTVVSNTLSGSNRTLTVRIPGVTDYIHVYNTSATEIRMRCSIGYTAGAAPASQPNVSRESVTNVVGPFPNLYFFADSNEVWAVVQIAGAIEFRHFTFGVLNKVGAYTGGTYIDGSYRDSSYRGDINSASHAPFVAGPGANTSGTAPYYGFVRLDIPDDSVTNGFYSFGDSVSANTRAVWTGVGTWAQSTTFGYLAGGADANAFDNRSILHPVNVWAMRTGATPFWSPVGNVRNTRICNMTKFSPTQEITIGSETWKLFPVFKRSMTSDSSPFAADLGSHTLGYAVKKVP